MGSPFGTTETNGGVGNDPSELIWIAAIIAGVLALIAFATGNPVVGVALLILAAILLGVYLYRKRKGG